MVVRTLPRSGQPMAWDEYERLGEDPRAEYIDGRLVVTPGPTYTPVAHLERGQVADISFGAATLRIDLDALLPD